jgi:hypothetical protein
MHNAIQPTMGEVDQLLEKLEETQTKQKKAQPAWV